MNKIMEAYSLPAIKYKQEAKPEKAPTPIRSVFPEAVALMKGQVGQCRCRGSGFLTARGAINKSLLQLNGPGLGGRRRGRATMENN